VIIDNKMGGCISWVDLQDISRQVLLRVRHKVGLNDLREGCHDVIFCFQEVPLQSDFRNVAGVDHNLIPVVLDDFTTSLRILVSLKGLSGKCRKELNILKSVLYLLSVVTGWFPGAWSYLNQNTCMPHRL
jgi:hypothetical protein